MPDLTRSDGRAAGFDPLRDHTERLLGPGLGRPTAASQACLHPHEDVVAATVEVRKELTGYAAAWVALLSAEGAKLLRPGHRPAWSPDGTRLAHLVDNGVQVDEAVVRLEGSPERLAWSPDGSRLLVVVAERGSEVGNLDGSGLHPRDESWLPHVSSSSRDVAWRRLVVVDLGTLHTTVAGRPDLNIWDACWSGPDSVVVVGSDGSSTESAWYTADLRRIDLATGADQVMAKPPRQLGAIAASETQVAYVDAVCSDRDLSAGELHLLDLATGEDRLVEVPADVSCVSFVDGALGWAGVRGLSTLIGVDDRVLWESESESAAGPQPQASFQRGRVAFVRSGHHLPPEACLVTGGSLQTLVSFAHPGCAVAVESGWTSEVRRWTAPDGLELDSWLLLPDRPGPHPLIVSVHGGPVASHRAGWPGGAPLLSWLLSRGYAVWQPNPRGSSGRGLSFADAVVGDMGGADAVDIRTGVEALIADGTADPARIGVMGGSYGGFMSAWLVTQCDLFAAAVPMFPVTDWSQQHGISNIPSWDALFLAAGQDRDRSPLGHAEKVRTPTLFLAGGLDRATPAGQALSMHRALVARGVPSECVTYPEEGHGTKNLAATVDAAARVSDWFDRWMPSGA